MPTEILMPALSPTMKEGNLARWLKKEGDQINAGDIIAEIETDKATMEVEAVDEGTLGKIIVESGTENVPINSLIGLILEEGEDKLSLESYEKEALEKNTNSDLGKKDTTDEDKNDDKKPIAQTKKESRLEPIKFEKKSDNKVGHKIDNLKISPLAKRIAIKENIDISSIKGSGPNGRIIKDDLFSNQATNTNIINRNPVGYKLQKNGNVRKVIAQRLLSSKQNVPHFYLNCEVEIDKLLDLRKDLNDNAILVDDKPSYKISVNDLIIKSTALALKKVPEANSSWDEDAIILYNNVDISIAVAVEDGLITPIVRNADQKSIISISNEMKVLAKKARDGKLQPEEFQGGGFSISNLGMYGIDSFSAIVNPPQSCILAVGAGVKKAIVKDGKIVIGNVMILSLSCDHRSVDGAVGAIFLKALKEVIQNPIKMIL